MREPDEPPRKVRGDAGRRDDGVVRWVWQRGEGTQYRDERGAAGVRGGDGG